MIENAYEINNEGLIQIEMKEYGRPDRGLKLKDITIIPFEKDIIDNALGNAYRIYSYNMSECVNSELSKTAKEKAANQLAIYNLLHELNFDVRLDKTKDNSYIEIEVKAYSSNNNYKYEDFVTLANPLSLVEKTIASVYPDKAAYVNFSNFEDLINVTVNNQARLSKPNFLDKRTQVLNNLEVNISNKNSNKMN